MADKDPSTTCPKLPRSDQNVVVVSESPLPALICCLLWDQCGYRRSAIIFQPSSSTEPSYIRDFNVLSYDFWTSYTMMAMNCIYHGVYMQEVHHHLLQPPTCVSWKSTKHLPNIDKKIWPSRLSLGTVICLTNHHPIYLHMYHRHRLIQPSSTPTLTILWTPTTHGKMKVSSPKKDMGPTTINNL